MRITISFRGFGLRKWMSIEYRPARPDVKIIPWPDSTHTPQRTATGAREHEEVQVRADCSLQTADSTLQTLCSVCRALQRGKRCFDLCLFVVILCFETILAQHVARFGHS